MSLQWAGLGSYLQKPQGEAWRRIELAERTRDLKRIEKKKNMIILYFRFVRMIMKRKKINGNFLFQYCFILHY